MTNQKNKSSNEIRTVKHDDEFIVRIRQIILENMKAEGFGVRMLCKISFMSRTQLHIKMKSITGRSTSHYIKFVRIQKACQLLLETNLNITQIAIEVGVDSLPYFSRIFRTETGFSPHNYRGKIRSEQ
ncbi:helix-turn-helix domain-containing protein [Maribellus mangrovi]|uniref:helix-turn-helix domain-containing protein n=1 Tax=Maribellus mangrovi TaxID=3133146 RepID=UPI0030EF35D8